MRIGTRVGVALGAFLALQLATFAQAVDGRIEINHVNALAGGITGSLAQDPAGYPVQITQSGSYVLTSDLFPPDSTTAIHSQASNVTIDLNGFGIHGPGGGPGGHGVFGPSRVTVKNGVIKDMGGNGVLLGNRGLIEGVTISSNQGDGIGTGASSFVRRSRVEFNDGNELNLTSDSVYQDSLIQNGTSGGFAVIGAVSTGGSICDGEPCAGLGEINQSCAAGAGCFVGDGPGFPVSIIQPGSYRLIGDLTVSTVGSTGVTIAASNVTLDLGGHTIQGPGAGTGGIARATAISGVHQNVEIRNGTLRDFDDEGVFVTAGTRDVRVVGVRAIANGGTGLLIQSEGSQIRDCTVTDNGGDGIRGFPGGLLIGNTIYNNTGFAMTLNDAGYVSNAIGQNNGGNANPQVNGGVELGENLCATNANCP